jgi:hypothetical protein
VDELKNLGLQQVELDQYGYVYTFIPSNVSNVETRYLASCFFVDAKYRVSTFLTPTRSSLVASMKYHTPRDLRL